MDLSIALAGGPQALTYPRARRVGFSELLGSRDASALGDAKARANKAAYVLDRLPAFWDHLRRELPLVLHPCPYFKGHVHTRRLSFLGEGPGVGKQHFV